MFAYVINTYCGCGSLECQNVGSKKTLLVLDIDADSDLEQTAVDEILLKIQPDLDEKGAIQLDLDVSATEDVFTSLEGVLGLAAGCHALLKAQEKDSEKDEFLEETLDLDVNI